MNRTLLRGAIFWSAALPLWAASPAVSSPPSLLGSIFQTGLALALVLALIIASAWLMRRLSLLPRSAGGQLRVVSGVMVGNRERVVLVEVRDTWLVLGVTGQNVNVLHTLPRPDDVPQNPPPPFAEWFQQALQKRLGKKDVA
jgi:flagellar protein FliO/FliZ